jgi:hypothetical protein
LTLAPFKPLPLIVKVQLFSVPVAENQNKAALSPVVDGAVYPLLPNTVLSINA